MANEEFHSSEQFIQLKKAEYFKDEPAMTRILASTDAQDSKDIARDITNYNHKSWSEHAEELCYDGIKNKFMQNPRILNHLLETRDKTIIEACTDEVWGSGISLGDKNCLNATKVDLHRNYGQNTDENQGHLHRIGNGTVEYQNQ